MKLAAYDQSDLEPIVTLFTRVFTASEGQAEGSLVGNLVAELVPTTAPQDIYGFTATESETLVGCIFLSRLRFENSVGAFLLSPVAVHTDFQRQGIGQSLIRFALEQLRKDGIELVFTYGDPDYYASVGFKCITEAIARAPCKLTRPEGWLCQSLTGAEITPIAGQSRCVKALDKPEYW